MYTAAVIGSGMIANEGHIPACLAMNERVNLRAVCGRNPDTIAQTAKRYGIPGSYTDVEEMLEKVKPDIVSVCTPNQTHAQCVSMALKAGCHVLCEKPVGLNSAEVKALYALAEKQNRLLIACQTLRFQPEWMQARKLVQSGELGEIIAAGFDRIRSRGIPTWGGFHRKAVSGGGAMADIGVHLLDGLLWMLGNPKVISVTGFASDQLTKANPDLCCPTESSGAGTAQVSNAGYQGEQFDVEEYAVGIARPEQAFPYPSRRHGRQICRNRRTSGYWEQRQVFWCRRCRCMTERGHGSCLNAVPFPVTAGHFRGINTCWNMSWMCWTEMPGCSSPRRRVST